MNKNEKLSVEFADVTLPSPIGVGALAVFMGLSVSPETTAQKLVKFAKAGAGYIEIGALFHAPEDWIRRKRKERGEEFLEMATVPEQIPVRRWLKYGKDGYLHRAGAMSKEGVRPSFGAFGPPPELFGKIFEAKMPFIKRVMEEKPKDVPLIANVEAAADPESYAIVAKKAEEAGFDMVDLNVSCPFFAILSGNIEKFLRGEYPLANMGSIIGDSPQFLEEVVKEVVREVSIPVGVKLSPETGFPRVIDICRRVKNAGAKFIISANMGITIPPPNIYDKGRTPLPFTEGNPFIAYGGDPLRVIVRKHIAAISRYVPDIDSLALGGIITPEHIIEMIMLGAKATGQCAAVFYRGVKYLRQELDFIVKFMNEQGYEDIDDIRQAGIKHIVTADEAQDFRAKAEVNPLKCTLCGICADNVCAAISIKNGEVKVSDNCMGCGLCVMVCPNSALRLVSATNT
jgi:dihydroorotate dehydrogenase/Pyruvate/2-oxoacid:ferredoxin oxidoreductase delta subunit